MDIIIRNADSRPIYEQIYAQLRGLILAGKLQPGEALPSMRALAKELRISVITTKRAYEELERDGFLVSQTGRGTFVAPRSEALQREQQLTEISEHLCAAATAAHVAGLALPEFLELAQTVFVEE